jgi:hypothetical protein
MRKFFDKIEEPLYSLGKRIYTNKQLFIANNIASEGVELLKWSYTLFPNWPLPDYCYAMDVPTLEWIHSSNKPKRDVTVRDNYCPPLEVLEWMICIAKPKIIGFNLNELAKNKYFDLLEKIHPDQLHEFINSYQYQYELLCWMIDTNKPLTQNYDILPFLAGGGKRSIIGRTRSTDGFMDVSYYKCKNVGAERVKHAIEIGYTIKDYWIGLIQFKGKINEEVFIAAVEANNIELLNYLHTHVKYDSAEDLFNIALDENHYETTEWLIDNYDINRSRQLLCSNVKILLYLKEKGFIWDASVYVNAICNHDLTLIQYFHENNVPWRKDKTLDRIPHVGIRRCMRYSISKYIVKSGNVEILKWCISNNCPLSKNCCEYASTIPMIQYLTSLGYPPTSKTLRSLKDNVEGVNWLCHSGIKLENEDLIHCLFHGSTDVRLWFIKNKDEEILKEISSLMFNIM